MASERESLVECRSLNIRDHQMTQINKHSMKNELAGGGKGGRGEGEKK